jgi:amidohydrolase
VAAEIRGRVTSIAQGIASAFGASAKVRFGEQSYPATVNDAAMAGRVRAAAVEVVGEERVRSGDAVRTMAAEDFSEFITRVPGCYFFVGARNEATGAVHPHHSPHFDLCEQSLPVAVAVLERAALGYLNAAVRG